MQVSTLVRRDGGRNPRVLSFQYPTRAIDIKCVLGKKEHADIVTGVVSWKGEGW